MHLSFKEIPLTLYESTDLNNIKLNIDQEMKTTLVPL